MAPDMDGLEDMPEVEGTILYRNLREKLFPAFFTEAELIHQLSLAYLTYGRPRETFNWDHRRLGTAFTWENTCQGDKFWRAVDHIIHENWDDVEGVLNGN